MVLRSLHIFAAALACLVLTAAASGQHRPLTVAEIYSDEGWTRFNGSPAAPMRWVPEGGPWLNDAEYLWPSDLSDSSAVSSSPWLRVDAASGKSRGLYARRELEAALIAAGAPDVDAQRATHDRPATFNADRSAFVLRIANDLYAYEIPTRRATRLTSSPGIEADATFSPDGRRVAYVRDHDLFVTDVDHPSERRLTTDGSPRMFSGTLDWVYSEELYGRGNHRAFWWSPDSTRLAFLRFDERSTPEFTLLDDIPYHPTVERWPYPKAGDQNPVVRLAVVSVKDVNVRWIDTSKYAEFLIVSVAWAPDSRHVVYQIQDRQQTWLDLNRGDAQTGATVTLFRERGKPWVERYQDPSVDPIWLRDGSFLWLSERSGWRHLYRYAADGTMVGQITQGEWEVRTVNGLDESGRWVYYTSTRRSAIALDLERIQVKGGAPDRLSSTDGTHRAFLNPSGTLYLESWSDITTPPQVRLHRAPSGDVVRTVDANPVSAPGEYGLSRPELLHVKTRDGFLMEAMMIKPPGFDPAKRYPVYQVTYGGPHFQTVLNRWGFTDFLYYQLLAQHGIIVWICDNRTASGKGMASAWPAYGNLGATELADIEDGLVWLKQQSYVDAARIGIGGTSYGGFMTLYALTHSRMFAMGIAEAPVSDWRNYDTIYTERYMGLPKENADGYRRASPRFSAANLHGELLLVHSALDDNVHPQNTTQFAYELQKAGKPFRMMIYPKSAHGVENRQLVRHLREMMLDFTVQNLLR